MPGMAALRRFSLVRDRKRARIEEDRMYSYISLLLAAERAKDLQTTPPRAGTAGKPGWPGGRPAARA